MSNKKPVVKIDRTTHSFRLGGSDFSEFVGRKLYRDDFHTVMDEILNELDHRCDTTHHDFNGLVAEPYGEPYYEVTWEGHDAALSIDCYLPCYIETEQEWKYRVKTEKEALRQWELDKATEKEAKELKRIKDLHKQIEELEKKRDSLIKGA